MPDSVSRQVKGTQVAENTPGEWRPKRSSRLSADVAADVVDRIVRGSLPPGTTLPNEAGLCEYYDVSRPVVREALKVVEQKGLIRIRQGDGTTVRPREEWILLNADVLRISLEMDESGTLRRDVLTLRRDLEMSMVERSAGRYTDDDFAELDRLLDRMDAATEWFAVQAIDDDVHRLIHRVSGNEVARAIVYQLVNEVRNMDALSFTREEYDESNASLRRVRDRLREGDGAAAAAAMGEHITGSWFFGRGQQD
jgi:DNA-binding FadR family transcriptional regulator